MISNSNEFGLERQSRRNGLSTTSAATIPLYAASVDTPYNWEQVLRILRKNLWVSLAVALCGTALIVLYAFHLKDTYQPIARVEIDPLGSGALSARETENAAENYQEYAETQVQILQSEDLAMKVIRSLRLDQNPEIVGAKELARYGKKSDQAQSSLTHDAQLPRLQEQTDLRERTPLEDAALRVFQNRLAVGMVRGSRLIEVSFASHEPHLAQQVTNSLVSQFIDRNFKTRYMSTMQASDWLANQLSDLRQKVETSNQAVVDYQKHFGLIEQDEKDGPTSQQANETSHQLSEAQADRIQTEAYVRMIDTGQSESLPQVHASQVYQTITSQFAEASAKLAQAKAIYGEENNNYKKLENEVNELAAQRAAEEARIVVQVRTAYDAARERERLLTESMNQLRLQMGDVNERMVRYRVLKNEAQANSELYNTLLARLKEAGLYAGLKSSNIQVVDPAWVLYKPTGPHRGLIIAIGTALSGVFAIVLAFLRESLNNTIRTPDDAQEWTGLPPLATVPLVQASATGHKVRSLLNHNTGVSPLSSERNKAGGTLPVLLSSQNGTMQSEALRELRTALLLSQANLEKPLQVILVASSAAGEGKSTVAINLASALSQRGRTCLMDGDLHKPTVAAAFGYSPVVGWSQLFRTETSIDKVLITSKESPNLCLLPAGAHSSKEDSIGSERMKSLIDLLRSQFQYIVIDSPPSVPFSDARVLAPLADGVVVVGRWGLTTRRALKRCVQRLEEVGAPLVGVIVNAMDYSSADYQYYNFGFSSGRLQGYGQYTNGNSNGAENKTPDDKPKANAAHA